MKNYINERDKKYIENYCLVQMDQVDLIRVKSLACLLEDKYCLYEIVQYIREDLKIDSNYIWRGDSDYIITLPRGHVQITQGDLYYQNVYYHQYIVHKELNIKIEQLGKYIIHHVNMDKKNNNINNLWVFYDTACHIAYHQAIKHKDIDIKSFTMDYIESIITDKNATEIKYYLEILDKLQATKKKKCLDIGSI